jgi:hypothetical protein
VVALAGAYLVAAAPMLLWAVINPDNFNARSNQVGIIQNGWLAAEMIHQNLPAWRILLQQFANSLLIFNFFNAAGFYNATIPALGPITGAAFAFGLLAALLRLRDTRFALLSSWFWVTLIIGQVLVVSPWASAYRTLGITPAVCILAAVALVHLADRLFSSWPKISRTAAVVIIALALVFEGGWNLWNYFGVWAPRNNFPDPESQLASLIGDYMAQQPLNSMTYMAALPDYTASGWATIEYLRNSRPFEDIKIPMDQALPTLKFAPRTVFIFPPERQNELAIVQKAYPGGQVVKRYVGNQLFFTAYQK